MLPQVTILASVNLAACIVEIAIFDKCAELRIPIVVSASKHLPGEVRVVFSAGSEHMKGRFDFDVRRFRIVSAYPGPGIRLESPQSQPQNEVSHKRATVNPGPHAAVTGCKDDRR